MDILVPVISAVFSILGAYLGVKFSFKEFHKKEIWLRKEEKYTELVNLLSDLNLYYNEQWSYATGECSDNNKSKVDAKLYEEIPNIKYKLEIIKLSKGFIMNKEVGIIIENLLLELNSKSLNESMGDVFSYVDRVNFAVEKAKDEIIKIANKDLGIEKN